MPVGPYSAVSFLFDHNASLHGWTNGKLVMRQIRIGKVFTQFGFDPATESNGVNHIARYEHAIQQLWRHMYTNDRVDGVIVE